jgi:hypothetical protein
MRAVMSDVKVRECSEGGAVDVGAVRWMRADAGASEYSMP